MSDDEPSRNLVPAYGPPPPYIASDVPAPASAEPPRKAALRVVVAICAVGAAVLAWWLSHR